MTRFTDRTIRTSTQWVKITRDNVKRSFTFARGRVGEFEAFEMASFTFKWCANWTEAEAHANRSMTYL